MFALWHHAHIKKWRYSINSSRWLIASRPLYNQQNAHNDDGTLRNSIPTSTRPRPSRLASSFLFSSAVFQPIFFHFFAVGAFHPLLLFYIQTCIHILSTILWRWENHSSLRFILHRFFSRWQQFMCSSVESRLYLHFTYICIYFKYLQTYTYIFGLSADVYIYLRFICRLF
jgi:hypothetical protein